VLYGCGYCTIFLQRTFPPKKTLRLFKVKITVDTNFPQLTETTFPLLSIKFETITQSWKWVFIFLQLLDIMPEVFVLYTAGSGRR
jgi:hypothetical protein